MKILQLGKFYPIKGGVEKVMWDISRGVSSRGIDCDMLCASLKDEMPEGGQIIFNGHGRCLCVKAWKKLAATMISPSMLFYLRKHCGEYDIIHIHHPDPMACLSLWFSGFKGRVILHWHSDIQKQKTLLKFYMPLQKWLIRRADRIVGTTPVYVAASPALAGVQDKVTFLPIGVEDNISRDNSSEISGKPDSGDVITVFSLGRLVEYKGYRYLVEAARYLPDNYRVVIGGGGPLKSELESEIEQYGLRDKVRLLGFVPDSDIPELYNSCDVFCLSSIMKTEAFGIVQIEAMSCGKPVVATHIPGSGVDWVNEEGISGLNVPICDAKALADAIVRICSDREAYYKYCENARARYESLFSFETMIDKCIRLYETE